MMKLQKYDVDEHYGRGAKVYIADLPSRAYLPEVGFERVKDFELVNMVKTQPSNQKKLEEIRQETEADQALQVLKDGKTTTAICQCKQPPTTSTETSLRPKMD